MSSITKQCIECIRLLLSAPEFGARCSSPLELCEVLQDGEILCCMLAILSPSENIPSSFYSVHSELLTKKNIQFFLNHCVQVFGSAKCDLFEPEDLLNLKNPERVVKSLYNLLKPKSQQDTATKPESLLANVIQEICNHEKVLVDKLMKLLFFRKELLGLLSEWSEEMISVVFRHTEQLYFVHREFHAKLVTLSNQGSKQFCQQLRTVFLEMSPRLEIYFEYFSHLPTAHARMETEFAANPELKNQLEKLANVIIDSRSSFQSYFDAPIRQTTNYLQLYERLAKVAAKEAPESKPSLDKTLAALRMLLDKANIYKRQVDNVNSTREIFAKIDGIPSGLANPSDVGLHVTDGSLRVGYSLGTRPRESRDLCFCVITTKQLLVASKSAKKQPLAYWFHVPINNTMEVKSDATTLDLTVISEQQVSVKFEKHKNHEFLPGTWKKLLVQARSECFPDGWDANDHHFEVTTFPAGTTCSNCGQCFNGSVLQGFACRNCNRRVDLKCLAANRTGCVGGVPGANYLKYFHTGLDRERAVALLTNKQPGSYLIREKGGTAGQKVMSVRTNTSNYPVIHIEILQENGKFALGQSQCRTFSTIDEMINYYKNNNLSKSFKNVDCKLMNGVGRRF